MKSQSSTEYLIVLAVVIIIGLIVFGVLGGIPKAGTSADDNAIKARVSSLPVGITSWAVNSSETVMEVVNNKPYAVRLQAIEINGTNCSISSVPLTLKVGQKAVLRCTNVNSSDADARFDYSLVINWTNVETTSTYSEDESGLKLVGEIATGSGSSGGGGGGPVTFWTNVTDIQPTPYNEQVNGLAVDSSDNVIVTGRCHTCGDNASYSIYTMKFDDDGNHQWTNITDPSNSFDEGWDVATDSNNNVIIAARCNGCGSVGSYTYYIIKFDEDGTHLWTNITDPSVGNDQARAIAVDGNDNILVTGYCVSGCGGVGGGAIHTIKFNENGTHLWTNTTDPSAGYEGGYGIAADSNDNVYVSGYCDGCGGSGNNAYYLIKYNENGTHLWTNITDPTASDDNGWRVAVDSNDDPIITGWCDGCGSVGQHAIHTVKFNSSGHHQWTNTTDLTAGWDQGRDITTDSSNNVIVTGYCNGCGDNGSYAMYTVKWNENGSLIWSNTTDTNSSSDLAYGVGVDSLDNVYVGGRCENCGSNGDEAFITFKLNGSSGNQS